MSLFPQDRLRYSAGRFGLELTLTLTAQHCLWGMLHQQEKAWALWHCPNGCWCVADHLSPVELAKQSPDWLQQLLLGPL